MPRLGGGAAGVARAGERPDLTMVNLVDRIAARLGFYRQPRLEVVTELIVFDSRAAAQEAGFLGSQHTEHPYLQAWWPGLGMRGLAARPWQRVTISHRMTGYSTSEGTLAPILRARQRSWGNRAMWIVL
jgi:hypothetical protein